MMIGKRKIVGLHEECLLCNDCGAEMTHKHSYPTYPSIEVYECPSCKSTIEVRGLSYPRLVYDLEDGDTLEIRGGIVKW